ncbi:MAG: hypothetical protein DID91_2727702586 [Candidatus Nitrotoga sp. MKT]|nr:MAG: hypothetical protein DID91_2727702586 [Candidatus Nitrotoga sp. MKT]
MRYRRADVAGDALTFFDLEDTCYLRMFCQLTAPDSILIHLTVHGELVEPPATHPEPFDKLRANGISLTKQYWHLITVNAICFSQFLSFTVNATASNGALTT